MRRKTGIYLMMMLCVMAVGGCKGNSSSSSPEKTETATPVATSQVNEQQEKETQEPPEQELSESEESQSKEQENQEDKDAKEKDKNQEKDNVSKDSKYKVLLKKGEVSSDGSFNVTYPQIEGWSDQESMEKWNQLFESANYNSEDDGVSTYILKTTVMTESKDLLSILMEGSVQYEGIEETTSFAYTYNINMKTGKSYRLKDSKVKLSSIEDKLMNENYKIVTKNQDVSMVAVLDTLYLKNEKDDDVARVKEALKECDYDENSENPACYSYWKNGKVSLVFDVDEAIGGYSIFELK